ncbi:oligoketide cyclase/lipid transport protein [secondary endosymbiont of Heteropsylla cubana]|uniref:Oligoketide cyclase/lipid transport protein n=1 Tax=secondary endosymbiont of Heteropsylla cubana TaxID=134287 RepID=J3TZ25_9ENTR|nr:SRPBCC family protein [secondary endosymbiont of Heteropsylla cubana]AFP85705.1 oligoketide cyclase/lipid transport protein [secondary endosymbiont of Heteropsylla cubana]
MPGVVYSVVVSYSVEKMFTLINNIKDYTEFILGCINSRIIKQNGNEITAEIYLSQARINKSFIDRNPVNENHSIIILLVKIVKGPY